MKLIGFAPWQHVTTSVPKLPDIDDIAYRMVERASANSLSKRLRTSHSHQDKTMNSVSNEQPDLILTTDHHISIVSHTASRKILKGSKVNDIVHQAMKELPQWIYTSRPGDQGSFLPKHSDNRALRIGAVVDANSRSIFSLQNENKVLKIWSLDEEVTGPDEGEDTKLINNVELPNSVICMESIPYCRHSRVRIKDQHGSSKDGDTIQGGVIGLMIDGQIFVVLVSSSRQLKIGFFGGSENAVSTRSRRRSTSTSQKSKLMEHHLFAAVGYSLGDNTNVSTEVAGQKRKASTLDVTPETLGDVTLTTLSLDPKKNDTIIFCKHTIQLSVPSGTSSSTVIDNDDSQHQGLSGTYTKEEGRLKLPHGIYIPTSNGNGSSHHKNPVQIKQLDATHVGVVYQSPNSYYATILDIRYGECIVPPFQLALNPSSASIVDIGGLSTSILAVLSADHYLSIYDVRRAIILYQSNVDEMLETHGKHKCRYRIASDCFAGTIGIIRQFQTSEKDTRGKVDLSFSRIGMFDSTLFPEVSDMASKPLLKGSYNLARAIASSMATSTVMTHRARNAELSPLEQNMMEWISIVPDKNANRSFQTDAMENVLSRLEKLKHGHKNGSKDSLGRILSDCMKVYSKPNSRNDCSPLPQRAIDAIVGSAIEIVLATNSKPMEQMDALEALMICMSSGKVIGRNHFDKAMNTSTKDVLRSLLFKMKRTSGSETSTNIKVEKMPLHLISCLIKYCEDSLPEHMLVSMVHYVLCHISDGELISYCETRSENDAWHSDMVTKSLESKLKEAKSNLKKAREEEVTVRKLERRLAMSQRMFLIQRIITHSNSNTALLREALREGMTQADKGEVEVLMHLLARLLRRASKDATECQRQKNDKSASCSVSQWLSALIDTYLGKLLTSNEEKTVKSIVATRSEVSTSIALTKELINLNELLEHVQATLESSHHDSNPQKNLDVAPLPLYGIESLIF